MDIGIESSDFTPADMLSYDDSVAYDDQVPNQPVTEPVHTQLADRIGNTKVYLLSEAAGTRLGKVRCKTACFTHLRSVSLA